MCLLSIFKIKVQILQRQIYIIKVWTCAPFPSWFNFLSFHGVFGKNWPNNGWTPPPWDWGPLWEILDPPLSTM